VGAALGPQLNLLAARLAGLGSHEAPNVRRKGQPQVGEARLWLSP
jgi:hypothetical protein